MRVSSSLNNFLQTKTILPQMKKAEGSDKTVLVKTLIKVANSLEAYLTQQAYLPTILLHQFHLALTQCLFVRQI